MRLRVHAYAHVCVSVRLCVCVLFGQRPQRKRRGRSPVEYRGNLCVPSVCTSVHPPLAPGRLAQASQKLAQATQRLALASQRLALASQRLALASEAGSGFSEASSDLSDASHGWTDGRMAGRIGCTDLLCLLLDFVPSGSLRGRCPAYITATIKK